MAVQQNQPTGAQGSVLIAGYSEGLGAALERRFARAGYRVITVARHTGAMLQCDLADVQATDSLITDLDQREPALAEQYFALCHQPASVWTKELDIRPQALVLPAREVI